MPGRRGADRGRRRLRRRPARLRRGRSTASSRRASSATSARRAWAGIGTSSSFAGRPSCRRARRVTVEAFEAGDRIKVAGTSIGKGFQGTIKRHNFHRGPVSHGSHNVRKPGSIGASATPSRVFKGKKMAGTDGWQACHAARARRARDRRRAQPDPRPRRRSRAEERPRRDQGGRALMAVKAQVLGGSAKDVALDATVFEADVKPHLLHETVRAELNAARAGRGAPRAAGSSPAAARSRGARRARAAPARARSARRSSPAAAWPSRPACGASR